MSEILLTAIFLGICVSIYYLNKISTVIRNENDGSVGQSLGLTADLSRSKKLLRLPKPKPAPSFAISTLDGDEVTNLNVMGKLTLFIIFSYHCSTCRDNVPKYNELYEELRKFGHNIYLVSYSRKDNMLDSIENDGVNVPVLLAPLESNTFARDFDLLSMPSFCLLNEEGNILTSGLIGKDMEEWELAYRILNSKEMREEVTM